MGHPLIDEFCRIGGAFHPEFLRRCQRVFREEVQPQLDERDRLLKENAALTAQMQAQATEIERLKAKPSKRAEKVPA